MSTSAAGPQPISEAIRRRLQSWFIHGKQKLDAGSHDYAADLFVQCVAGDPGSLDYQRAFLSNLHKKYKNNKKGASFSGFKGGSNKSAMKKGIAEKDWTTAIKNGLELLRINPWETDVLLQMAQIVGEMQYYDAQLGWLKAALDASPKDYNVLRGCAVALAYLGDFDQAITMWAKVEEVRPNDAEPPREISRLQKDKLLGIAPKRPAAAGPAAGSKNTVVNAAAETQSGSAATQIQLTQTQMLQRAISEYPLDVTNYFQLAEHYAEEDKYIEAERVLKTALDMSGRDMKVQERLEDLLMRREHNKIAIADQRAAQDPSEANRELAQRLKLELARQEMEIYRARVDRYPIEQRWKFELGLRLKRLGNHHEAVKVLQEARHDPELRGDVLMELGDSLQQMKQYQPALTTYQKAYETLKDKGGEKVKTVLYRTGLLAGGLKDYGLAEKAFTKLVGLDFNYKDAGERLDKIQKLRHKQ
ncbi:MAG: hypothetical protein QM811_31250 [Pirellulales bacterium]